MDADAGEILIEIITGAVIVMVLLSVIAPWVAVIVDVPTATAVARPLALIVATDVVDDVHVAVAVIFAVEPSV